MLVPEATVNTFLWIECIQLLIIYTPREKNSFNMRQVMDLEDLEDIDMCIFMTLYVPSSLFFSQTSPLSWNSTKAQCEGSSSLP